MIRQVGYWATVTSTGVNVALCGVQGHTEARFGSALSLPSLAYTPSARWQCRTVSPLSLDRLGTTVGRARERRNCPSVDDSRHAGRDGVVEASWAVDR